MNSITNVPWFCTSCNMLCDECHRKKFDKTFNPYNKEDMKTLIKEVIKEYFDER